MTKIPGVGSSTRRATEGTFHLKSAGGVAGETRRGPRGRNASVLRVVLVARFLVLVVVGALIDPVAALVLVACIPFVPLSIALFQRFVRDDSSASREMRARLSAQFLEAIQGLSTLVGIGAADRVGERLARTGEDNRLAVMRVLARNQLILFVMEGVFSLFLVTAAIVVSWIRPPR